MKTFFQAKDIQRILNLPKYRYEYLSSKIGIKPDIDEVEGTGYAHLYSFKNLLQFAFVHNANGLGLAPKANREMISEIEKYDIEANYGIFDPKKSIEFKFFYFNIDNFKAVITSPGAFDGYFTDQEMDDWFYSHKKFIKSLQDKKNSKNRYIDVRKKISLCTNIEELLDIVDSYVTINIGNIKKGIMERISK